MKRIVLFLLTNLAVLLVLSITAEIVMALFAPQGGWQAAGGPLQGVNLTGLLVFSAIFGMGGSFISLAMSKWMAKRMTGAQVLSQPTTADERWLVSTVERLASQAGIGRPEIAVYRAPEANAFATGMRRDAALVAVSTGLLERMSHDEVEAVLGHEISHVANGDMVTMGLIQGVLNTFVIFFARVIGMVVDRVVFRTERGVGIGYWLVTIVAQIFLGILASIVVFWFSRRREFRADAGGAQLAGRYKMIAALEALKRGQPKDLPGQLAAFGIGGGAGRGFGRLFMTHPPLDERIEALRRLA